MKYTLAVLGIPEGPARVEASVAVQPIIDDNKQRLAKLKTWIAENPSPTKK